ncbi:MAG TPA: hypothetical protein VNT26_05750, partial [Candidatus Sulfotelmatobacter sp.]|nr:hypothetical protein [Candidatus Sulfotelmatobacter sp.]
PSLSLPVTYVEPVHMDPGTDHSYTRTESLEAGRYRRYFFNVSPGSSAFTVTARMPLSQASVGNGTVQMHVFRPDGQILHSGKIGVAGDGLTTLFQTTDPVPGVWEVVVVALPDQKAENANPNYTLEAKIRPGALGNQPLRFSAEAGSLITVPVKVSNVFGAFSGNLSAVGLVTVEKDAWTQSTPWRMQSKQSTVVETFTLKEYVSALQIEVSNPTRADLNLPAGADPDLSLYLYRILDDGSKEQTALSVHAGTSAESIPLSNVLPGTYRVVVTSAADGVQFQYRRLMGLNNFQAAVKDDPRLHQNGDVWTPTLTIQAPTTPGRYTGYLLLNDTINHRILGWYPFEVSVGQPSLAIRPMDTQLTRGRASNMVLEVRDAKTSRLMSGVPVTVNGRRYLSVNGQVSVQLVPEGDKQLFEVNADLPAYRFFQDSFTLPVRDAWGLYPLGIDKDEENSNWRRKVINQLP